MEVLASLTVGIGGGSTVRTAVQVAGSASDFTPTVRVELRSSLAAAASVAVSAVMLNVGSGSTVELTFTIAIRSADPRHAVQILDALSPRLANAALASALLNTSSYAAIVTAITLAPVGSNSLPLGGDDISDEAAEDLAAATATAATELGAVLATVQQLDTSAAQAVTSGISSLLELMSASDGSPSSAGAAESIGIAVDQLARAATVGVLAAAAFDAVSNGTYGIAEPVVLSSANLNMSINLRNASALATMPIVCDASTGVAAAVTMPADLIGGIPGMDASLPVVAVLYASRFNLHGGLVGNGAAERRRQSLRRRLTSESAPTGPSLCSDTCNFASDAECDDGGTGAEYFLDCTFGTDCDDCGPRAASGGGGDLDGKVGGGMAAGPTISFKLMQQGIELVVKGLAMPINISLAYQSPATVTGRPPCVGAPDPSSDAARACVTTVECRFWNETNSSWSTNGCTTTMDADGSVGCSCTHLTEFIAFEFPTTVEQLLETVLGSFAFNRLDSRALECALDPARSWGTVRPIWDCIIGLMTTLIVALVYAVRNDRHEAHRTLALLAGQKQQQQRAEAWSARSLFSQMCRRLLPQMCSPRNARVMPAQIHNTRQAAWPSSTKALPPPLPPADEVVMLTTAMDDVATQTTTLTRTMKLSEEVREARRAAAEATFINSRIPIQPLTPSHTSIQEQGQTEGRSGGGGGGDSLLDLGAVLDATPSSTGARSTRTIVEESYAATAIQRRWKRAQAKQHAHLQVEVITKRWHQDVNAMWKRVCIACTANHSLCAGFLTRGVAGFTRAQTIMMLFNGFAFELVMLCLFYESPPTPAVDNVTGLPLEEAGPAVVVNPVDIVVGASAAAIICIPMGLIFGWVFDPIILVNVGKNLLWLILCWPYWLVWKRFLKRLCNRPSVVVETCIIVKEGEGPIGLDLQQSSGHRISIVRVQLDTPAARSVPPLVAGMRIVGVDGVPVKDAKLAAECIAKAGHGQMKLEVEATRSWLPRRLRAGARHGARQASAKGAIVEAADEERGAAARELAKTMRADVEQVGSSTIVEAIVPKAIVPKAIVLEAMVPEANTFDSVLVFDHNTATTSERVLEVEDDTLASPPPPAMSVITLTLKCAGDISSFTFSVQTEIAYAIAAQAGVQPSAVEVTVKSGSVIVDAKIRTPTATATLVLSKMADATSSTSSAIEMLMKVTGIEIAVLAIVHPATSTVEQTSSSTVSPPPSPPVLPEPFSSPSPTGLPQGDVPPSPPSSPGGTVSMVRLHVVPPSPPPSPPRTVSMHRRPAECSLVSSSAPSQTRLATEPRTFSYASLSEGLLKASLTYNWKMKNWANVRKILLGWSLSFTLFGAMCFTIFLYGCQLFEPYIYEGEGGGESGRRLTQKRIRAGDESSEDNNQDQGEDGGAGGRTITLVRQAGNADALIFAWLLSCFQRFVLFEPTLILANKGLPMLFASAYCATCCGEAIVESLSLLFLILTELAKSMRS